MEYFNPQTNLKLELSETSSMVSEMAPIVAHLKYVIHDQTLAVEKTNFIEWARKKGVLELIYQPDSTEEPTVNGKKLAKIIFIEEPEAHLHPIIQAKLMEIFVKLANSNIKIVMTTHSDFMFNKLNNLILDHKIVPEKVCSYLLEWTPTGSVADTEKMKADANGMDDQNFVPVAELLYEERMKLYDKSNQ